MEILKVQNILPGKYTIKSFEQRQSKFGKTYTIEATTEDGIDIIFWANSYLSYYIINEKPTKN